MPLFCSSQVSLHLRGPTGSLSPPATAENPQQLSKRKLASITLSPLLAPVYSLLHFLTSSLSTPCLMLLVSPNSMADFSPVIAHVIPSVINILLFLPFPLVSTHILRLSSDFHSSRRLSFHVPEPTIFYLILTKLHVWICELFLLCISSICFI